MRIRNYGRIPNPNRNMKVRFEKVRLSNGDVVDSPIFYEEEPTERPHLSASLLDIDELVASGNTSFLSVHYSSPISLDLVESKLDNAFAVIDKLTNEQVKIQESVVKPSND